MTIEEIAQLCKELSVRWTGHILERIFRRGIDTMICFMCKGMVQEGISTFTADMGGSIIIIKNVPSYVCGQCGETSYSNEVTQRLEQIVKNIMASASAEIAVVNYSEKAA